MDFSLLRFFTYSQSSLMVTVLTFAVLLKDNSSQALSHFQNFPVPMFTEKAVWAYVMT